MALTDEHKTALAEGRRQARDIRAYLEALATRRRGRPATPETLRARLARLETRIANETDALRHLELVQARIDVAAALESAKGAVDMSALEDGFITSARAYGQRKGIGYAAWRESGVPAAVLKAARIPQTRNRRS